MSLPTGTRCVLFMTAAATPGVPVAEPGMPAAMLPLGAATFAEKVMESCAAAGFGGIDLVTSDAPEALRDVIGDGWRWNLQVRWHTVRDAEAPYSILRSLGVFDAARVVIGHGHHWISPSRLATLAHEDGCVVQPRRRGWAGWASMPGLLARAIPPNGSYAACEQVALAMHAAPAEAAAGEHCTARTARDLLDAQHVHASEAPPTWRREPWGIASPAAHIHPEARITGPVLAGPGAVIEKDAQVGPNAVICESSVVTRGARVRDAIVLPHTWVGGGLLLEDGIARGSRWLNVRLGTCLDGRQAGGLLSGLREAPDPGPSVAARLTAALACAVLVLPWFAARLALGRGHGVGGWRVCRSVQGHRPDGTPRERPVRVPAGLSLAARVAGLQGGLVDIVQGRRCWIGMRPRDAAQWRALPADWQALLSSQPVGLVHAAAWRDPWTDAHPAAEAAADAYLGVARPASGRMRGKALRTRFSLGWRDT